MSFPFFRSQRSASRVTSPRPARRLRRRQATLTLERLEGRELLSGEPLAITLTASQTAGGTALTDPVDWTTDATFFLNIYVQDQRADGQGVTGGTLDVQWTSGTVTASSTIEYGTLFANAHSGSVDNGNHLVDEVGATTADSGLGTSAPVLLCSIEMTASAAGAVTFSVSEGSGFSLVDSGNLSGSQIATTPLTVEIDNHVNHAPVVLADAQYTVPRGGTLSATDPTGDTTTDDFSDDGLAFYVADMDYDTLHFTVDTQPTHGALTLNSDGTFTYVHDGSAATSDSFSYTVSDGTDSTTGAVQLSITPLNHAPTFSTASLALSVAENMTAVATVQATDEDSDTLSYSLSGADAALFHIDVQTGVLTFASAPSYEAPGDVGADNVYNVDVTAADPNSATAVQHLVVTVTDVNEAPVLDNSGNPSLGTIAASQTDSAGTLVSTLLNGLVTDGDGSAALQGIAIIAVPSSTGTWQYSLAGGSSWAPIGTVSEPSALLLRATDKVRFVPDGTSTDEASFTFVAWDQTGTTAGQQGQKVNASSRGGTSAFSIASESARITVTDVNSAPVLTASLTTNFPAINEDVTTDNGVLVSTLIGTGITDADGASASKGIAVYAADTAHGVWQYATSGSNWASLSAVTPEAARLLAADATTRIRFVPATNYNGTISSGISYRAWDQSDGSAIGGTATISTTGSSSAFSSATASASITVNPVNDAPVLNMTTYTIPAITEDPTTNDGVLVSTILGSTMTDVDGTTTQGIAVYAADNTNGSWQYTTDNETTWTAFGTLSTAAARLLAADGNTRIRFVPTANYSGTVSSGLTFRAWDQSSGSVNNPVSFSATGGSTAFSSTSASASITVTPVNDAPVLDTSAAFTLTAIDEDASTNTGTLVSTLISSRVSDADGTGVSKGIAVYNVDNTNGTWQFLADGSSSAWTAFGTPSTDAARLLASTYRVRFVPNANYSGTVSSGLRFRAWDQTTGNVGGTVAVTSNGGSTAFSSADATASITVNAANDVPTIDSIANPASIAKNAGQQTIALTGITAGGGENQTLQVTATSSNTTLIPAANLSVSYTSPNSTGTLSYTPAADQIGTSTITVTVTDAGLDGTLGTSDDTSTTKTFTVTVGSASLAGYVYVDANNDGAHASTEYGISHVVVTLQQLSSGSYVNLQTVVTGSDGSYFFKGLPAGTYQIVESQPSNIRDGVATVGTSGGTVATNKITAITLAAGTDATGYNFGEKGLELQYIALQMCFTYSPTVQAIYTKMAGSSQVTLTGTSSADTITVAAGTEFHTVTINGVQQKVAAAVDLLLIDGSGGSDTVTLTGTSEADMATIATNSAKLTSSKYAIQVKAAESITLNGVSGEDSAELNDSTGDDTLTASTSSLSLTGSSFTANLSAFKKLKAISTKGTDKVTQASTLDYVLTLQGPWINN